MTASNQTDLTYSQRLQLALTSEAKEAASYDKKGGQEWLEVHSGQSSIDPWKINFYK